MDNLYKEFNGEGLSEDEMIDGLKSKVDRINGLGSSILKLLKHSRYQALITIILYFTVSDYIWALSTLGLTSLTFLVASYKYNDRRYEITEYWYLINHFKSNGKINKDNEDELKNYGYTILPFER
jgi:hypothetical protein